MKTKRLLKYSLIAATIIGGGVFEARAEENTFLAQPKVPVEFVADSVQYEKDGEVLSAKGNVELVQEGRILKADSLRYIIAEDKVEARGNVIFIENTGDRFESDYIVLRNKLKDGVIGQLKAELIDESRIWARQTRKQGDKIVLKDARYTPCKPCMESEKEMLEAAEKDGKEKDPAWQIKASTVTWDKEAQTISYKNARFEVGGVPVFYTPYFRHPDGTVTQKSGLLRPSFGYRSQLGAFWDQSYYIAIDEDKDATLGLMATTQENAVGTFEYRQNFGPAVFNIEGSATSSGRTENVGGINVVRDDSFRGHVFSKARWDMNENWRSGLDVNLTTDDQYLRQYDFDDAINNEDVLTSQFFAERFGDRSYGRARMLSFQDTRVTRFANQDQPFILPMIEGEMYGDPGATLGGRWGVQGSALNLYRDGKGLDITRFVGQADWERQFIAPIGLVTTTNASLRGDAFFTRDIDPLNLNPAVDNTDEETRIFPRLHTVSSLPLAKPVEGGKVMIEPMAALTLAPNLAEEAAIPNEDSADTLLDVTNLFEADRFTGLDRIEDSSRATYGIRTGYYDDSGNFGDVFLGQSYRFQEQGNPFSKGSGLSDQSSDVVGAVRARFFDDYDLNYRFQYDGRNWQSRRHEVNAGYYGDRFGLSTYYFFLDAVAGTGFTQSREQIASSGYLNLNDNWRLHGDMIYDLGVDKTGLLQSNIGVDYSAECYVLSFNVERNFTDESSGESETSFTFRVGLKNLSEFDPQ